MDQASALSAGGDANGGLVAAGVVPGVIGAMALGIAMGRRQLHDRQRRRAANLIPAGSGAGLGLEHTGSEAEGEPAAA